MNLDRLFRPRTVAVYGGQWGDYVADQCRKLGFDGELWRVHPRRAGCYANTNELPAAPDSAFLGIKNDLTIDEIRKLRERGAGGAVVFASGFAEVEEGKTLARQLGEAAADLPYIGPNCYGFANLLDRVSLWPDQVSTPPVDRGVAILTQSGTVSITLMGQRRSLPIGYVITLGNQQQLGMADIIRYVAADERITAIGLYLEGISDMPDFIGAVDEARLLGKPVVAVKVGKSAKAQATAFSHTGALTGSDQLYNHLFDRLGIARCQDLSSMVETLKLLHCHGPMPSKRLTVMGASGGDMSMVSDLADQFDIEFPLPPDREIPELEATTGPDVKIDNPFDFHTYTWFDYVSMKRMFSSMLRSDYALTAFILDPPDDQTTDTEAYDRPTELLVEAANETGAAAAMLSSLPESISPGNRKMCLDAGVAPMQGLREFLFAFHHAARIGARWQDWQLPALQIPGPSDGEDVVMSEAEGKAWLEQWELPVPQGKRLTPDEAVSFANQLGFPVVMKASGSDLAHKTELNAVRLNLKYANQVKQASQELAQITDELLVEQMIDDTVVEILLGITVDDQFGINYTVGAGGTQAELHRDTVCLLPPLSSTTINHALDQLRCSALLNGWRGQPAGDREALVTSIIKLARFAEANLNTIKELDINPLLVRPKGRGVIVADALIRVRKPTD